MALSRSNLIRNVLRLTQLHQNPYSSLASSRNYSNAIIIGSEANIGKKCAISFKIYDSPLPHGSTRVLRSTVAAELSVLLPEVRTMSTQVKPSAQVRQSGACQVAMVSPGIIYEPYGARPSISFWQRWFTRDGWRRTKEDMILELKNAYAVAKLRKTGYSKKAFYNEAFELYKEYLTSDDFVTDYLSSEVVKWPKPDGHGRMGMINKLIADGDKTSLRKSVTENMFSGLKNEIKQREAVWKKVHWELVEPAVKIRTLRARLIGVDRNNLNKVFIQLTMEFLTKQKFEAYDSKGAVVAGDKNKEVLVCDIWVFEKSLFHRGAYWRLCGRLNSS